LLVANGNLDNTSLHAEHVLVDVYVNVQGVLADVSYLASVSDFALL
jgi:hypothetical protein